MYGLQSLVVAVALAGAVIAVAASAGKLSGRLGERAVARLYYVSYGCTAISIALFVMHGLFARGR
jgi:hypothetical protein